MAKKKAIACARISSGKISLQVRYAELAAADARKKTADQRTVCVTASSAPRPNRNAEIARRRPEPAYVALIIGFRPTVSKSRPMVSGPRRFPAANARKKVGTRSLGTA